MVVPNVHGNVEEMQVAVMANPGEHQVKVEATNLKTVDLERMTRSTSLYRLQDTQH